MSRGDDSKGGSYLRGKNPGGGSVWWGIFPGGDMSGG